ncbi:MAG: Fis family transcriptional regulator [Thermoanaerobaculia bacterium]
MSHELFSEPWLADWVDKIRASEKYKVAARNWQWPMILIMERDPSLGFPQDRALYLDLFKGDCREGKLAGQTEMESTPFIISADAFTWKQVLERKLEPISGLIRGKLKLKKGNLATLIPYVLAAKELVNTATEVPTSFPEAMA